MPLLHITPQTLFVPLSNVVLIALVSPKFSLFRTPSCQSCQAVWPIVVLFYLKRIVIYAPLFRFLFIDRRHRMYWWWYTLRVSVLCLHCVIYAASIGAVGLRCTPKYMEYAPQRQVLSHGCKHSCMLVALTKQGVKGHVYATPDTLLYVFRYPTMVRGLYFLPELFCSL